MNKEEQIQAKILEINTLVDLNLSYREAMFIKHTLKEKRYNVTRAYLESCVMSIQNKLLASIIESEYKSEHGDRYRVVKTIDNMITYICQEIN